MHWGLSICFFFFFKCEESCRSLKPFLVKLCSLSPIPSCVATVSRMELEQRTHRDSQLAQQSFSGRFVLFETRVFSRRLKRPCLLWELVEVILLVATGATAIEGEEAQEL